MHVILYIQILIVTFKSFQRRDFENCSKIRHHRKPALLKGHHHRFIKIKHESSDSGTSILCAMIKFCTFKNATLRTLIRYMYEQLKVWVIRKRQDCFVLSEEGKKQCFSWTSWTQQVVLRMNKLTYFSKRNVMESSISLLLKHYCTAIYSYLKCWAR